MPFSYLHSLLCVLRCVKRVGDVQSRHRWLCAFYSFTDLIDSKTRCRYSKLLCGSEDYWGQTGPRCSGTKPSPLILQMRITAPKFVINDAAREFERVREKIVLAMSVKIRLTVICYVMN